MAHATNTPWSVSVAQVGQRAGQTQLIDADFPAPSGIGDEVVGVTEGEPVHVEGSFDSIIDGLILNAHISAPLHAVCTRCLLPLSSVQEIDVIAFFPYEMKETQGESTDLDIVAGEDEADDGNTYPLLDAGSTAFLESLLRDNLVEAIPAKFLCKPDCKGLCSQCGINLNEHPDHFHEVIDDRFAVLADLKAQLEQGAEQ